MEFVKPGMKLGLGTGSTAAYFVDLLGEKVAEGLEVLCVPTSSATKKQAEALGIPLTTLGEIRWLDLVIDGGHCGLEPTTVISMVENPPKLIREGKGTDHGLD